jgi:hypothetical protein
MFTDSLRIHGFATRTGELFHLSPVEQVKHFSESTNFTHIAGGQGRRIQISRDLLLIG